MSTIYKSTVQNVLQLVSDARGETTTNTDAFRIRSLSKNEQAVSGRRKWMVFLKRLATLTGDDTNDYTIGDVTYPARQGGLSELFVGGTAESNRYAVVDYFYYLQRVNADSADKVAYEYYDPANDAVKVHINPAPTASDTIYYSYYWVPPTRTTVSDVIVCPDIDILVNLTLGDIAQNADEDNANDFKSLGEQLYLEASNREDTTPQNQLRTWTVAESKGIGSY